MSTPSPRIASVQTVGPTELLVSFVSGEWRRYDISPLLERSTFWPLRNPALFRNVRVDAGGYGILWNQDIDLSEHEIWTHGIPTIAPSSAGFLEAAEER
jgi:hypothetical protein